MCKVASVKHAPSESTWETLRREDPEYAGLAIHWRWEEEKERSVYVVEGVAGDGRKLKTNAADVMTTCAAILERMIYAKISGELIRRPCRSYGHYNAVLKDFKVRVVRSMGHTCEPCTAEEFVELYKGRKHTLYESVLDDYLENGVKRVHAMYTTFMKVEKVPVDKSPRCIQPRDRRYNIAVGRYLKPQEKRIFRAIAKVFRQKYVVFKGLNANQAGEEMAKLWDQYAEPVAVGLDASRFDASVDEGMLQWEHSVYNMIFQSKELKRLLSWQLRSKGIAWCFDGKITYHVQGGRGSGDMNTSLGNCLIMCAIVWTWLRACGVKASLCNNGDDCIVIMEKSDLELFSSGFSSFAKNLGFTMVVEDPVFELEKIEFCQTHPLCVNGEWRMVRNFHSAREKDSMCLFPLDNKGALMSWLYAVGECGLALCSGVPVFQAMYEAYMRNGRPSKMSEAVFMQSGSRMLSRGMEAKHVEVDTDARVSFFLAFDVTPDEQVALEEYYSTWKCDGHVFCEDDLGCIGGAPM